MISLDKRSDLSYSTVMRKLTYVLQSLWHAAFGQPAPSHIWQTTSEQYLREEKEITCDWFGYTYWKVYAVSQRCVATGKTRVIEDWRVSA